jgi:hypothetical protein
VLVEHEGKETRRKLRMPALLGGMIAGAAIL